MSSHPVVQSCGGSLLNEPAPGAYRKVCALIMYVSLYCAESCLGPRSFQGLGKQAVLGPEACMSDPFGCLCESVLVASLISVGPLGTQRDSGAYPCLLLRVTLCGPLLYQGLSFLSSEMGTPDIFYPCE